MKLNTKFTLYFTFSKLLIFGLFLLILPFLFHWFAQLSIDKFLHKQQHEVFENIRVNGLEHYLQGEKNYGSYTMLKEDYIAIQTTKNDSSLLKPAAINIEQRVVDTDTIGYRILQRYFMANDQVYLLEIGRSQDSITIYADLLQQVALGILIILFLITVSIDYFYGRYLLSPLQRIIRLRLTEQSFPFKLNFSPIKTTTRDFQLLDEKLCELMDRASKAYLREKEFTANASHELLTPISILRGKIENMLSEESASESNQEKLFSLLHTLERLSGLVKTLLFLARVDSGQYQRKEVVKVSELLKEVSQELSPIMEEKDIQLYFDLPENLEIKNQHSQLLFQLFSNLINNAIRYNRHAGYIKISAGFLNEIFHIDIEDNGIGMNHLEKQKLFERFHSKLNKGQGLGLSIVKSIADFLEIRIKVSSEKDLGTKISLYFDRDLVSG